MIFASARKHILGAAALVALATGLAAPHQVQAQSTPCIGELMIFGGNFCPRNWANTDGQLLDIASHTALFSLLGTMYGGDGRTTFGLPDLQGRAPISHGTGTGLSTYAQGEKAGAETIQLTSVYLPSHTHAVNSASADQDTSNPAANLFAAMPGLYHSDSTTGRVTLKSDFIGNTGGSQAFSKRAPYQALRYCIALEGIYCSRN